MEIDEFEKMFVWVYLLHSLWFFKIRRYLYEFVTKRVLIWEIEKSLF